MPRTRILLAATLLLLMCAACSAGGNPSAHPLTPSPTTNVSSSSPAPTSLSSDPPSVPTTPPALPYLEGYTSAERSAYDGAVRAYDMFADEQARILEAGRATPTAKRYYKRYSGDWLTYWNVLRQRAHDGIRIDGRGQTLRVRPALISISPDGSGTVKLRVCGISKGVRVFHGATEVPQPAPTPRIVNVSVIRLADESWWRVFYERLGGTC